MVFKGVLIMLVTLSQTLLAVRIHKTMGSTSVQCSHAKQTVVLPSLCNPL